MVQNYYFEVNNRYSNSTTSYDEILCLSTDEDIDFYDNCLVTDQYIDELLWSGTEVTTQEREWL